MFFGPDPRKSGGRGGIIDAMRCGAAAAGRSRYCVTLGGLGESLDPRTNKRGGPWPYLRLTGFIRIRNEGIARSTVLCSRTWREPEKGSRFPATWVPIGLYSYACVQWRVVVRHVERWRTFLRSTGLCFCLFWWKIVRWTNNITENIGETVIVCEENLAPNFLSMS